MYAVQILVDTEQGWVDHDRHLTLPALSQTKYLSGRDELLDFAPALEVLGDFPMTGETLKGNLAS